LQKDGLETAKPYRSIFLTEEGQELALYCKERHEIVRNFLISIGVDENTAEQDAEGVEHHVSPQTLEKFLEFVEIQGNSQN